MNEWLFMGCAVWEIAQKRERETCVHVDNEPHDTYVFVDSEICICGYMIHLYIHDNEPCVYMIHMYLWIVKFV